MHASVLCVFTGEKLNGDMNQVERLVDRAASVFVDANIADYGKLDYNRNSLLTASKGILGDEVTAESIDEHRFSVCNSEDFLGSRTRVGLARLGTRTIKTQNFVYVLPIGYKNFTFIGNYAYI